MSCDRPSTESVTGLSYGDRLERRAAVFDPAAALVVAVAMGVFVWCYGRDWAGLRGTSCVSTSAITTTVASIPPPPRSRY